jgi:hypothetical protein
LSSSLPIDHSQSPEPYADLPCCPDDCALRRHIHSIPPQYIGSTAHDPAKNPWAYSAGQSKIFFTDIDKLAKGEETFEEEKEWLWGFKRYGMSKVLMNMFMFATPLIKPQIGMQIDNNLNDQV